MNTTRRIATQSALVLGAVLLSAGIQTLAFTDTNATPPTDDAYAPLTTSNVPEIKEAGLTVNRGGAPVGLVVNGAIKMNNSSIECGGGPGSAGAGAIRYNAGKFEGCDGTTWASLTPLYTSSRSVRAGCGYTCGANEIVSSCLSKYSNGTDTLGNISGKTCNCAPHTVEVMVTCMAL